MKPLDQKSIDKCLFGVIDNLDVLFSTFLYCKDQRDGPSRTYPLGHVWTPKPEGFYFLNSESPNIETWLKVGKRNMAGHLNVKPLLAVKTEVKSRCCEGNIGAFKIIPWKYVGYALICASDKLMIAQPWLAFIKLENIPIINQDNTATWDGKNENLR